MGEAIGRGRTRRVVGVLLAALASGVAAASAGCGEDTGSGAERTAPSGGDQGAASRPALAQVSALARAGAKTPAPMAALADPQAGPQALAALERKLTDLSRGPARVAESVERNGAPLPAAVIASAKLQIKALERGADLAGKLAKLEDEANRERAASAQAQDELTALAGEVDDLRPLAREVAQLQSRQLGSLRRLLASAQRIAERAGVVAPTDVSDKLRADPDLRAGLWAAVSNASQTISGLAASLAPADVVVGCGDDPGIYRLSARNLTCEQAHQLAVASVGALAPTFSVAGFECAILGRYAGPEPGVFYGADDVRCERGSRAIQFDFAD